jgi:hypothetical protein
VIRLLLDLHNSAVVMVIPDESYQVLVESESSSVDVQQWNGAIHCIKVTSTSTRIAGLWHNSRPLAVGDSEVRRHSFSAGTKRDHCRSVRVPVKIPPFLIQ